MLFLTRNEHIVNQSIINIAHVRDWVWVHRAYLQPDEHGSQAIKGIIFSNNSRTVK